MHVKTQAALTGLVLVAATALITFTDLDRETARLFYLQGAGFVAGDRLPWRTLYRYGEWPALFLVAGALLVLAAGFAQAGLRRYRRACVFLLLVYLLGPGLLINGMLKTHWDRPRPVDVVDFGGAQPFVQLSAPTFDGPAGRSFPSGHASVAFYLASPWFLLRSTNRRAARLWLGAGLAYGGLMGLARMVQGAHFLSDIVWSWGIVHLLGLLLAHWLRLDQPVVTLPFPARPASASIRPAFVGWVRAWPAVLQPLRVRAAAAVPLLCAAGMRDSRDPQIDPVATQGRRYLVKGAVSLTLLALIGRNVDLQGMATAIAAIPPPALAAALALQLASNCVAAGRWHLIMHRLGVPGSFAFYLQSFFKGALFNQGLPSSIGGDGLRILDVARIAGRREDAVIGVFLDRFVGLAGLLLLNLAALLVNRTLLPDRVALPLLACLILLTVALAGLFVLARIDLFQQGHLLGFLGRLSARCRQVCATAPALTLQAGLSILTHLLAMAAFAVLGHGAGLHYPLQVYLALVPPAVLLTILPVSLAGWGLREGAMVGLFLLVGADKSMVLTFSIVYGLVNLIASLPGLAVYLGQRQQL
jgi:membrane-associated PAP2 superfamily phosphatase/uncharacterized membrane protein YbhN (UPF0104 family)